VWRREGRDVPFGDILDGTADFDLLEMMRSMIESAAEEEAAAEVPTSGAGPRSAPAGTATTGSVTSGRSRKSSA
jgi:hypothetical protein